MKCGPMLAASLPFLLALGCTLRLDWPDHEVVLLLDVPDSTMHTVAMSDIELSIDAMQLRASSIELVPCDRETNFMPPLAAILGPASAHAHGIAESTTRVVDQAVILLGGRTKLATWRPPEGRYCSIEIEWGPTEDGQPTLDIRGMESPNGEQWSTFNWKAMARATSRVELDPSLDLGSRSEQVELRLVTNPVEWVSDAEPADPAFAVLQHAVGAWEIRR